MAQRFLAYRALAGFTCQAPVFALFYLSHGLGYRDLMLLAVAFAAARVVCDVPSGVFADVVGRRAAILARVAIEVVSVLVLFDGYLVFSSMLAGAACAFSSTAESALVYEHGRGSFEQTYGRAGAAGFVSTAVAALAGAALATIDFRLAYGLRLAALVGAGAVAFGFEETAVRGPVVWARPVWQPFLMVGILGGVHVAALQLQQPFLKSAGLPLAAFGAFYVVCQLATAAGSRAAGRVSRPVPLIVACSTAGFAIMALPLGAASAAAILLLKFAHGVSLPVFGRMLNDAVPATARATTLSLRSLFEGTWLLAAAPLLGFAADAVSLHAAFAIAAVLVLPAALFVRSRRALPALEVS